MFERAKQRKLSTEPHRRLLAKKKQLTYRPHDNKRDIVDDSLFFP